MPDRTFQVLFRKEEESWTSFARRVRETDTEAIVVLSAADASLFAQKDQWRQFLEACAASRQRIRIATRQPLIAQEARRTGIRVFDKTKTLKQALEKHPQAEEALRLFSPGLWRQKWRSRLQTVGLLTLPRLRILALIVLSAGLFLFVMLRLLPSAEIRILPRGDLATQTTNLLLVQSGTTALPSRIRTLPLLPFTVQIKHSIVFDQISKQFIGTNAEVPMTLINKAQETASLRKGTRLRNQAGMVFRIQKSVLVPAAGTMSVRAMADEVDGYGEIIGERGNVPAGLQWELPALTPEERKQLYAENRVPASGGKTAYRTVLQKTDLDLARRRLEQELLAGAKKEVEARLAMMNLQEGSELTLLTNDQLVRSTFSGFVLPLHLLNQPVASITVEGHLHYRMLAYDAQAILTLVRSELQTHIPTDKRLVPDTVDLRHMDLRVFDYADDLSWIKATAELSATEQYVLDALSPTGARFAKGVRERVVGLPKQEALRIIQNLPEVEKAEIRLWPPWSRSMPSIPSNIAIVPM